jgi:hypothetical protein
VATLLIRRALFPAANAHHRWPRDNGDIGNVAEISDTGARRQGRSSIQSYAAAAGLLFIISFAAGGFGEAYVPSMLIVPGDAAATASSVRSLDFLYRLGFAAYLIEAICDIAVSLLFYTLLKPVNRNLALLAAFFGILSTALFAVGQIFFLAPMLILNDAAYLKTFSPDQLSTLALLSFKLYALTSGIFMVFYGIAWILRGWLIFASGYLPRLLGLLLILGGAIFGARSFFLVLAPNYPSGQFPLAIMPGAALLALWLLLRGVNVERWEAAINASD